MFDPIEPYCAVYGSQLNVEILEDQIAAPLTYRIILGQIAQTGRYKGNPYPYSACHISVPNNIKLLSKVEWLADFMFENMTTIKSLGAEEITFWIVWRGKQGNMELSAKEIQKISKLNIDLGMDYQHIDKTNQ
jgi:hypothetical protein